MDFVFCNSNDKDYQKKLNRFLKEIFLDFQFWYDLDLWDHNYESYAIEEDGEIVSNVCVYKTRILFREKEYDALSVGAVATREDYRGRGYAKLLMNRVMDAYLNRPVYLFANENALGFYEKLGFKRQYEKIPVLGYEIDNLELPERKLRHDDPRVYDSVFGNRSFSRELDCINTGSVNLFHLYSGEWDGCIYQIPEIETIVVAKKEGEELLLQGVFSKKRISFSEMAQKLPFSGVKRVRLSFMPQWDDVTFRMEERPGDSLFVKNIDCDLGDFKFPELSTT